MDLLAHKPGSPSASGVLDVGMACPHSCVFCYYSHFGGAAEQFGPLRAAKPRSTPDCLEILGHFAAQGLTRYDITGGEPAIHPDLEAIVRHGTELGLSGRLITLGQLLTRVGRRGALLERLLDAGLADVLFSLHAPDADSFRAFTGGELARTLAAMEALDARGFQYGVNTVVFAGNAGMLEGVARLSAGRGVYVHNFILFNAYHAWAGSDRARGVRARYADVAGDLARAVDILDRAGVAVNVRFAPLCVFQGLARHVVGQLGTAFDPFEWRNRACNPDRDPAWCARVIDLPPGGVRPEHVLAPLEETLANGTRLTARRGEAFTVFAEACARCAAQGACDGLDRDYLERFGDAELRPLESPPVLGPLIRERLDYAEAFLVKMAPGADMRAAIARARASGVGADDRR